MKNVCLQDALKLSTVVWNCFVIALHLCRLSCYYLAISLELLLDPCCSNTSPQFQRSELSLQESKKWECCSLCGVGFTSLKQAEQHYNGKNHAKKLRLTEANACLEKAAEANIVKK